MLKNNTNKNHEIGVRKIEHTKILNRSILKQDKRRYNKGFMNKVNEMQRILDN